MPAAKSPSSKDSGRPGASSPPASSQSKSPGATPNRSREQLESATRRVESATQRTRRVQPVERLVRGAERARRSVVVGGGNSSGFPIAEYDELTVAQVEAHLPGLAPAQLRKIRDYERSHANRKSVLAAVENLLG